MLDYYVDSARFWQPSYDAQGTVGTPQKQVKTVSVTLVVQWYVHTVYTVVQKGHWDSVYYTLCTQWYSRESPEPSYDSGTLVSHSGTVWILSQTGVRLWYTS